MSSGLTIDIAVEAGGWSALDDPEGLFQRCASAVFDGIGRHPRPGAELSVLLADDKAIRDLNRRWRGKDAPTNVLSFPAAEPDHILASPLLGDIALAFETVRAEAADEKKSLRDHTGHLFVHGLLHILGFDHEDEAEAEAMEQAEIRILATLGIADPYAGSDPGVMMADQG